MNHGNILGPRQLAASSKTRGAGLIIVMTLMSLLLTMGIALISVVGQGNRVSGNLKRQEQALHAAETGVDVAWTDIEAKFGEDPWPNFSGRYLTQPTGIDLPGSDTFFRALSDIQILNLIDPDEDGLPNLNNIIFFRKAFIPGIPSGLDSRYTYTVFLIDDEAGIGETDPNDVLLVSIGCAGEGAGMITARIEVELTAATDGI